MEVCIVRIIFGKISITSKQWMFSQLLVKILQRSNKEKNTFKAIEKHWYGLWKTVSKHLKNDKSE